MQIVLTGGHGFIGTHMISQILARGHRLTVIDVLPQPPALEEAPYAHLHGDVLDLAWLRKHWPPEVGAVIHLVGLANFRAAHSDPHRSFQLNVASVETVLEACGAAPPRRFVLPSAAAVYGLTRAEPVPETAPLRPMNIYSAHKYIAEQVLQAHARRYGIAFAVLRLFNVYGRGQRGIIGESIRRARAGEPLTLFAADQLRDFVHVSDVVDAFARAAESDRADNQIFNIGAGWGVSIKQVVDLVRERWPQLQVRYVESTDPPFDSVADNRRAREFLAWEPHASLDFLRQCIAEEMNDDE